jgi:predicted nucleic acid-binding protein
MSGRRATYVDSSALVELVISEPESAALGSYLARPTPLVASAIVQTEVARARPQELRSLDAIHLATAQHLADELSPIVTYDRRMAAAATDHGFRVVAPT